MSNVSGFNYENTPFSIPSKMVGGKDTPTEMVAPYVRADRRNVEQLIRHFNTNSREAQSLLRQLKEETTLISDAAEMTGEDTVVVDINAIKRILSLAENLHISFDNLLKTTE